MKGKFFLATFFLFFLIFFIDIPAFCNRLSDRDILLNQGDIKVEHTDIIIKNIQHDIRIHFINEDFRKLYEGKKINLQVNGKPVSVKITKGEATFPWKFIKERD